MLYGCAAVAAAPSPQPPARAPLRAPRAIALALPRRLEYIQDEMLPHARPRRVAHLKSELGISEALLLRRVIP